MPELNHRKVAVASIRPNSWNYNKQSQFVFEREVNSIRRFGILRPILVRKAGKGFYEIVDGEHRWRAAKQVGVKRVSVIVLDNIDDLDAKQLTILMNEIRGDESDAQRFRFLLSQISKFDGAEELLPYTLDEIEHLNSQSIAGFDFGGGNKEGGDTTKKEREVVSLGFEFTHEEADEVDRVIAYQASIDPPFDKDMKQGGRRTKLCVALANMCQQYIDNKDQSDG